jgi:hypothetical protein
VGNQFHLAYRCALYVASIKNITFTKKASSLGFGKVTKADSNMISRSDNLISRSEPESEKIWTPI